ncbi:MAG: hypothetical protein QGD94_09935, partial [Planctomycetia bacterium]|nr:hypothetical protein [Planctomycetia bacterium]
MRPSARICCAGVLAALVLMASGVCAGQGQAKKLSIIGKMPRDCIAFMVAENLKTLEASVRELIGPLEIPEEMPSFEEKIIEATGLPAIFDMTGNWAIIVMPPNVDGREPMAVWVAPVKNINDALKALGAPDDEGIFTPPSPEGDDLEFCYMRYRGYIASSDDREDLIALKAAKARYIPSRAAEGMLKKFPFFAHFNVKGLVAAYKNEIEDARKKLVEEVERAQAQEEDMRFGPPLAILKMLPGGLDVLLDGLYQIHAVDAGVSVGKDGVTAQFAVVLDKKGSIARAMGAFSALKKLAPPLPDVGNFITAGWLHYDSKKLMGEYVNLLDHADKKMDLKAVFGEDLIEEVKASMKRAGAIAGNNHSFVEGGAGEGG